MKYFHIINFSLLLSAKCVVGNDVCDDDEGSESCSVKECDPQELECMRFSKVSFPDSYSPPKDFSLPLGKDDYPIRQGGISDILNESNCPTVVDHQDSEDGWIRIRKVVQELGDFPSHPSCNPRSKFWEEMEEVIDVTLMRQANENAPACEIMELPDIWDNFTLAQAAEAVHDEYPGENQAKFISSIFGSIKIDKNIIPQFSNKDFVRGPVMLAQLNTWAVSAVGLRNFQAKWHFGRARPEEVAFKLKQMIKEGDTECFPESITTKLQMVNFDSAVEFTAYPEGSPSHPSWPAMHSAASSSSFWLAVVADLTPEQLHQARLVDYAVAYGRTVAGVHYRDDNLMGLKLGQQLVEDFLPTYLEQNFGTNPARVERKIEKIRRNLDDWDKFVTELQIGCKVDLHTSDANNRVETSIS